MRKGFRKELENLLASYSKDIAANMDDFILAKYLDSCLNAFIVAQKESQKIADKENS